MNDLLKNVKWPDTGLDNRIHRLTRKARRIEKHDTLTPDDWAEIVEMAFSLDDLAIEVLDCAIEQRKRGIGGLIMSDKAENLKRVTVKCHGK